MYNVTIEVGNGIEASFAVDMAAVKGEQGIQGVKGDTGKGFTILGTYATVEALAAAVTDAEQGDYYNVGTEAPYRIYMWDDAEGWQDQGQLQGPTGAQGEPGPSGPNMVTAETATTLTGLLKGDGTTVSAAVAGEDYAAAAHTHDIAGIIGSEAKGSATDPIYWDGTAFEPITSYKEKNLAWGGRSIANDVSPVDAAMSNELRANRVDGFKPAGVTAVEYTNDNGTTWIDYGADEASKRGLFSDANAVFYLGKRTTGYSDVIVGDGLRITLNAYQGNVYMALKTILIYFSDGSGQCTITIEKAKKDTPTTFDDVVRDQIIGGGAGWNSYPYNAAVWGGNSARNNYGILRFTMKVAQKPTWGVPCLYKIKMFGTNCWASNTNMAKTDHAYTWDENQNVIFPANVKTQGNFLDKNGRPLTACSSVQVSLPSASWSSNKQQTVSVAGVTANSIVTVTYAPASRAAWIDADVYCSAQGAGTLTFTCDTVPTQALTANIVILA